MRRGAFPLGVSNAKYLTFDTLNTKKPLSLGVLNPKIFGIDEQYNLKFESVSGSGSGWFFNVILIF